MAFEKLGSTFNRFFGMDEEPESYEEALETETPVSSGQPADNFQRNAKVISMTNPTGKPAKIVVYEPRLYSDANEIGKHLLNNHAVVVNFDRIGNDDAKRIVDFLNGTVFAISGNMKRIGAAIFLVTPANFEIDGDLANIIGTDAFDDIAD
ncbi:cell division protein SepF [Lacticaseibacillus brantae]|uniref:Cell division protein SepF n=1 Tax=Lacticaseibacillus brantae DSM 23927 TaxID=1423727 RepID=A0A0R2AYU2_9LACO|nr:cell division protein SepF [Lacticaseibacillus brantae]KRM72513.1 cell division protein [Lacticaseibacillus brantae DSM 23927]